MRRARHVVGLGVDDQPALLEAEVAAWIPSASRTNELAPSAPTSQRARTVRVSPVATSRARVVLCDPTDGQLSPVVRVAQPLGHPATLDRDAVLGTRATVERLLELGLEEHVVRLPTGWRRARRFEAEEQLAVGAEPLVVRTGMHWSASTSATPRDCSSRMIS